MQIFSIEVQRRVRLRHAKKFDLSAVLGEPLIVWVGELPQVHQDRVVAFLQIRRELIQSVAAFAPKPAEGEAVAVVKEGEEATTPPGLEQLSRELQGNEVQALDAAARVGNELSKRLLGVMQELIAGAMLDVNGDRISEDDAAALFSLLPASKEVGHLLNEMSEAVLSRIGGGKLKKSDNEAADPAPKAPPAELGK